MLTPDELDLTREDRQVPGASSDRLTIELQDGDGPVITVTLAGEVDLVTAPRLDAVLAGLIDEGYRLVTLDMRHLDFIDSQGLGVLLQSARRLRDLDGDLIPRSPQPLTRRIFEITGIDRILEIDS